MKTILITGCSSGIGKETALTLARAGHRVFASMRNLKRGNALKQVIEDEQLAIDIIALDVDHDQSVQSAVEGVLTKVNQLDVLVNNAGIAPLGHIEETPISTFKQMMETNFFGAIRCIQSVLPHMRSRKSGMIVNISSVSGRLASSPYGAYTASKHALEAMSECLAQEVRAHNIHVANIEPGFIETPILDKQGQPPSESIYPQWKRLYGLVAASRQMPTPPSVVAQKVKEVIEDHNETLRHPVGPDAQPFLHWRGAMTDEQWIAFGGLENDEDWYKRVEQDFGIDARMD